MAAQSGGSPGENLTNKDDSRSTPAVAPSSPSFQTKVKVNRPVYTQLQFNERYNFTTEDRSKNVSQQLRELVRKQCTPSGSCIKKSLLSCFPFIGIMSQYNPRHDIFSDIIAGLTVGIMHIPQGQ